MGIGIFLNGVPMVIGLWAQAGASPDFKCWKQVRGGSDLTGAEPAEQILYFVLQPALSR